MKTRLVIQLLGLMAAACVGLGATLYHFRLPLLDLLARRVHPDHLPPGWVTALAEHHLTEARANLAEVDRQLRAAQARDSELTDRYRRLQHEREVQVAQIHALKQVEMSRAAGTYGTDGVFDYSNEAKRGLRHTTADGWAEGQELLRQHAAAEELIAELSRRRTDYLERILKLEARRQRLDTELEQRHAARFGIGRAEEFFQAAGIPERAKP